MVRIEVDTYNRFSIWVDSQHISRMSQAEVSSLIAQLLTFGGVKLRDKIRDWLDGKIQQVAEVIAPETPSKDEPCQEKGVWLNGGKAYCDKHRQGGIPFEFGKKCGESVAMKSPALTKEK